MTRKVFPDDHYVTVLRGHPRPRPGDVHKRLAARAAWLVRKVNSRILERQPYDLYLDELAAIVEVVGILEQLQTPKVHDSSESRTGAPESS